jgi:HD-GYP domain-containing protein (c-di-GMP phosphodiesterase class II)
VANPASPKKPRPKFPKFSRKNLRYAQAILDSINFRAAILDSDHTILMINSANFQDFSIDPKDFIGKKCFHFRVGEKCEFCPLEKAATKPSIEECEYYDQHSKRWFRSLIFPLPFVTDAGLRTFALIVIDISDRMKAQSDLDTAIRRYEVLALGTIEVIQAIIGKRDPYQVEHQVEVSRLAIAIAGRMGLKPPVIEGLGIAAQIHDLGKIAIPAEILMRPGRLVEHEYALIKTHPKEGYDILRNISFPFPLADIVHQHHERIDGSGYPRGLKGEEIMIEAKILAVAEVVEAMSAHRPYRSALSLNETLQHIQDNRGILYDPDVVDTCIRLFREGGFSLRKKE